MVLPLNHSIREYHKKQLDEFIWPLINLILPQFDKIKEMATEVQESYVSNFQMKSDNDDYCEVLENSICHGIEHYNMLRLGRYIVLCTWHSTLYEIFFQQFRLYLFRELQGEDFQSFCPDYKCISQLYEKFGFDLAMLPSWSKILELQLLCNVIKHSDGNSAKKLREINPGIFMEESGDELLRLFKTTLLKETLQINESTIIEYLNHLKSFWEELPAW